VTEQTLIVLAGALDAPARTLAERWAPVGAVLVTPASLSVAGWRHSPGDPGRLRAPVGGRLLGIADIGAVLVRLPCVTPGDLPHIAAADREYVAEEMTAFLLSWLSELPCRVVNRPTPTCLAGPALRDEQWVRLASELGIPCRPALRRVPAGGAPPPAVRSPASVTVIGAHAVPGGSDPELGRRACALAAAAGADLLVVHFDAAGREPKVVGADLWADLGRGEVADALLELLSGPAAGVAEASVGAARR